MIELSVFAVLLRSASAPQMSRLIRAVLVPA